MRRWLARIVFTFMHRERQHIQIVLVNLVVRVPQNTMSVQNVLGIQVIVAFNEFVLQTLAGRLAFLILNLLYGREIHGGFANHLWRNVELKAHLDLFFVD